MEKVKAMAMKNIFDEDESVRAITASVLGDQAFYVMTASVCMYVCMYVWIDYICNTNICMCVCMFV